MTVVYGDYLYIFDDVSFGIAIREGRQAKEMTQEAVGKLLDHTSGHAIGRLENAKYTDQLTMKDYIILCNFFDIPPFYFWDVVPNTP